MKKITYVFLIAFMIVCFSGCNRNKWNKTITCTAEEKENIYCNYNFDPVCGDDGQTYWCGNGLQYHPKEQFAGRA